MKLALLNFSWSLASIMFRYSSDRHDCMNGHKHCHLMCCLAAGVIRFGACNYLWLCNLALNGFASVVCYCLWHFWPHLKWTPLLFFSIFVCPSNWKYHMKFLLFRCYVAMTLACHSLAHWWVLRIVVWTLDLHAGITNLSHRTGNFTLVDLASAKFLL